MIWFVLTILLFLLIAIAALDFIAWCFDDTYEGTYYQTDYGKVSYSSDAISTDASREITPEKQRSTSNRDERVASPPHEIISLPYDPAKPVSIDNPMPVAVRLRQLRTGKVSP